MFCFLLFNTAFQKLLENILYFSMEKLNILGPLLFMDFHHQYHNISLNSL